MKKVDNCSYTSNSIYFLVGFLFRLKFCFAFQNWSITLLKMRFFKWLPKTNLNLDFYKLFCLCVCPTDACQKNLFFKCCNYVLYRNFVDFIIVNFLFFRRCVFLIIRLHMLNIILLLVWYCYPFHLTFCWHFKSPFSSVLLCDTSPFFPPFKAEICGTLTPKSVI